MGRTIRAAAAVAALALVAAACGGGSPKTSSSTSLDGGVLKIGSTTGIDSLNPFVAFEGDAYLTFQYVYPYLVGIGPKTEFVGDFAKDWSTSSDGLTWTFHTIAGATWSDGKALSAHDAAWTFTTMLKFIKGPAALYAGTLAHMASAVASDDTTLVLTYKAPVANVLSQLQQVPILPEHVWATYATGDGKTLKTWPNPAPMVSGGPFILVSYTKGQAALFKRNPSWYGPKAHIDGWGLQFFSSDDAMVEALLSKQIDAVESVPYTSVSKLKQAGFAVYSTPAVGFNELMFNSNPKKSQHRELLDPQVRLAVAHAIDLNQIVQTAFLGYAQPGGSVVPPATGSWSDPSIKPETYDPALANQMLDQLGYAKGSDGIRVANGHPMSYQVIFPDAQSGFGDRTFEIIQSDLQAVGIKVSQKTYDNSAAFDAIGAPDYTYLQYDMAMWDWYPYYDPDYILSVFTCDQYGYNSDSAYCNSSYDNMYAQQGVTIDQTQRRQIVYQMQQMLFHDKPYVVLDYPDLISGYAKTWAGFVPVPGGGLFDTLNKQSLVQAHRVAGA